jgi:hypothetical protein
VSRVLRATICVVFALVLVGALVELSCVAGERPRRSAAPLGLFNDPAAEDPPSMSEINGDTPDVAASPALTR